MTVAVLKLWNGYFVTDPYRDKFVAHPDNDETMYIPHLDIPKRAVWFYHQHIVTNEGLRYLTGLPVNLDKGYKETEEQASVVYRDQA